MKKPAVNQGVTFYVIMSEKKDKERLLELQTLIDELNQNPQAVLNDNNGQVPL